MSGNRFPGLRQVFRLGGVQRDIDEELAYHFDRTVEELMAGGLERREAEEEARRRFGDEERWRRELGKLDRRADRLRRVRERLAQLRDDVRYALRRIGRAPGLTAAVVLTFALGIGANATMFGVLDRLLLRAPAHIVDADDVQRIAIHRAMRDGQPREYGTWMSYPDFRDFTRAESYSAVAAVSESRIVIGRGANARPASAGLVTGEFFGLLGVRPALGRYFGPADDRPGGPGLAVISHGMWRDEYGGEPTVIGRTIDFGHGPYEIIGVAPEGFTGTDLTPVDVWLPLRKAGTDIRGDGWYDRRGWHWMQVVARLAPGVSPESAAAEATTLHRAGRREMIEADRYDADATVAGLSLIAARGPLASDESAVARWLAGVSLLVLLIACANVANLLLARTLRRRREFGIRLALGVSRGRLLGQVVFESLLLAALGGAAALLVTRWGGEFVRAHLLPDVAWPDSPIAGRVVLFSLGMSLLAGLVAGIIPGIQASRPRVAESLKSASRSATGSRSRMGTALTVFQAALSVVLLVGAGLFVRSLRGVEATDYGFEPDRLVMLQPAYEGEPTDGEQIEFHRRAVERLSALPSVEAAAESFSAPFWSANGVGLDVPGLDSVPRNPDGGLPVIHAVGTDYFSTMGLELLRGRGFSADDGAESARVAVVNEPMARTLWPDGDAIGQCLMMDELPCAEVVGVVEGAAMWSIGDRSSMQYYVPFSQGPFEGPPETLLARVAGEPSAAIATLRRELLALDARVRFVEARPYSALIDPRTRAWRLGATMFSAFGMLALIVAAIGLYSVLSFAVAQRVRELGIRSALGAPRARLVRLVAGQGFRLAGLGILLGAGAALVAAPRIEDLLFQTSARDPMTFGVVTAVLAAVAGLAVAGPALRAARIDPMSVLKTE
ncbi:MAG: ADOP family duplicated permease [Gemmatimonadota bacterium]